MCKSKLTSCSLFCVCLVLFWRRIPKLGKQKAHLWEVRPQLSKKQHKTGETETVIQNPTDTKSLSVIEDQPTTSGLTSQVQGSGNSCSSDTDFNPEEALITNPAAMFEDFTTDWVTSLQGWPVCPLPSPLPDHLARVSPPCVSGFKNHWQIPQQELQDSSEMVSSFLNQGEVPDFSRGKYERMNAVARIW